MKTEPRQKSSLDLEPNHPLSQPSKFKYLPLAVIVLLLLNLLATCNNTRTLHVATKNQPYIYVQTPSGTAIEAKPADSLYRSDAVIIKFAENWLKLAYTWKSPPEKGKAFTTERGVDFPYQFHQASVAIEPGYREAYMGAIAKKYQKQFYFANYITGQQQSYVRIYNEDEKQKVQSVEKGVWDVTLVATRIHASGNTILAYETFNHVIRVKAVKPSLDSRKLWGERDTDLGKLLDDMQHQGLQIVGIDQF